jgi:hypothetical protein
MKEMPAVTLPHSRIQVVYFQKYNTVVDMVYYKENGYHGYG